MSLRSCKNFTFNLKKPVSLRFYRLKEKEKECHNVKTKKYNDQGYYIIIILCLKLLKSFLLVKMTKKQPSCRIVLKLMKVEQSSILDA